MSHPHKPNERGHLTRHGRPGKPEHLDTLVKGNCPFGPRRKVVAEAAMNKTAPTMSLAAPPHHWNMPKTD